MEIQVFLFLYLIIIISSIIHEYSHGWMANVLGDPTAKHAGRLTLNPIAHIDLWGTIILPSVLMFLTSFQVFFGYAKPVPFNPYNFKNQKQGLALVGLAGPLANLLIAVILGLLVRFSVVSFLNLPLTLIVSVNIWLALFNLLPFAPADGSKILAALLSGSWEKTLMNINPASSLILAMLVALFILPSLVSWLVGWLIGPAAFLN